MSVEKPVSPADRSTETDGALIRTLLRGATVATLATTDRATGAAYASLVEVATSADAAPVLLLSGLARHTANLFADSRASLLVDSRTTTATPMTAPRATLIGRLRIDANPWSRQRFLRRHPTAAGYAAFADFKFWSLAIHSAHVIQGFGRIREVAGDSIHLPSRAHDRTTAHNDLTARLEEELLHTLNADAGNAPPATCSPAIEVTGLDWEGIDVVRNGERQRMSFEGAPANVDNLARMATALVQRFAGPSSVDRPI